MFYLSDVVGGMTAFVNLGLAAQPTKGQLYANLILKTQWNRTRAPLADDLGQLGQKARFTFPCETIYCTSKNSGTIEC
jgi:hypothetical protein